MDREYSTDVPFVGFRPQALCSRCEHTQGCPVALYVNPESRTYHQGPQARAHCPLFSAQSQDPTVQCTALSRYSRPPSILNLLG